ncbi:MAG: calcium-binding protein [Hyphomicrobiaceae bacterium]|nr:calcium-binding protein [Hyphomicrobiaceae bacterium]
MTIQTDTTSTVSLGTGDTLYVPADVGVLVATGDAINMTSASEGDIDIVVDGTIVSQSSYGLNFQSTDTGAFGFNFLIGVEGVVRGDPDSHAGVNVSHQFTFLSNAGQISGSDAVKLSNSDFSRIVNTGEINSLAQRGLNLSGDANLNVFNSGNITSATHVAVYFGDCEIGVLQNHGSVSGHVGVMAYSSNGLQVNNAGVISGTSSSGMIFQLVSNGLITNSGSISGVAGISIADSVDLKIINSGEISGRGSAAVSVDANSAAVNIINKGVMSGAGGVAISGNALDDVVRNSGDIFGDINLGGGADTFNGRFGRVDGTVSGDAGDDTLIGSQVDDDVINGGADNDTIKGRAGDDIIGGDAGIDHLYAGKGNDELTGGTERDFFHFGRNQDDNTVTDFEDGIDKLNLAAFGFRTKSQALSHFFEVGNTHNNKVGFEFKGTFVLINGVDLHDIGAGDVVV